MNTSVDWRRDIDTIRRSEARRAEVRSGNTATRRRVHECVAHGELLAASTRPRTSPRGAWRLDANGVPVDRVSPLHAGLSDSAWSKGRRAGSKIISRRQCEQQPNTLMVQTSLDAAQSVLRPLCMLSRLAAHRSNDPRATEGRREVPRSRSSGSFVSSAGEVLAWGSRPPFRRSRRACDVNVRDVTRCELRRVDRRSVPRSMIGSLNSSTISSGYTCSGGRAARYKVGRSGRRGPSSGEPGKLC